MDSLKGIRLIPACVLVLVACQASNSPNLNDTTDRGDSMTSSEEAGSDTDVVDPAESSSGTTGGTPDGGTTDDGTTDDGTTDDGDGLDEDGVRIFGKPKAVHRNWYLRIGSLGTLPPPDSSDRIKPPGDPRIEFEAAAATILPEDGITFVRLDRLDPTTDLTQRGSNKVRLHIYSHERGDAAASGIRYSWSGDPLCDAPPTRDPVNAGTTGYMRYPDDLKAVEYTLIARVHVLDETSELSLMAGGAGHHNGEGSGTGIGENSFASVYITDFEYGGTRTNKNFATEFDHGHYERYHANGGTGENDLPSPANSYGNTHLRWMGWKVVSMPRADGSARDVVTYFNEDPIDPVTGKPRNAGWKKHTMWSQNRYRGQEVPHLWGGALDFWRLDWVLFWDLAYASMVEIEGMPEE